MTTKYKLQVCTCYMRSVEACDLFEICDL